MTTVPELTDAAARRQIAERLDRTLFVEAGAGSGKTRSLVDRVVATVLDRRTGRAAAAHRRRDVHREGRRRAARPAAGRVRGRARRRRVGSERAQRAAEALDELDAAAIGTLHSFARRILTEHPIEAGLPPLIEVLDEVASGVAFDDRWIALRTAILDDASITPALLLAMAAGMKLDDLRSIARAFTNNWDLIAPRVLAAPVAELPDAGRDALPRRAPAWPHGDHCTRRRGQFLPDLEALDAWADRLAAAPDDPGSLQRAHRAPPR